MSETLRFCLITTFYPPYSFGGDGIFVYRLANALAARGHRVDVIYCQDAYNLLDSQPVRDGFANHPNINLISLTSRFKIFSSLVTQQTGHPYFKKKIQQILDNNHYDVVHYHNMSLIGISALEYSRAIKLYTLHEYWLICPMHVLWKYDQEICVTRDCLRCQLKSDRPPQLWRYTGLLKNSLKNVDMFIAPSRFVLDQHLSAGLEIPITYLPHFLAEPDYSTATTITAATRPYFLYVGRLEKIKGLQNIIPIWQNNPDYDLLIVGEGSYRDRLELAAQGATNIKFLGFQYYEKLQELYQQAIAVIMPSICYEVFGLVIIEAFANRTPVIAHNVGALPELVNVSNGGLIYNNETELIAAIKELSDNSQLRDRLGENGYRAYQKYWTLDVHFQNYFELIARIQSRHHATIG